MRQNFAFSGQMVQEEYMRWLRQTKIAGSRLAAAISIHMDLSGCTGRHHGRSHRRSSGHRLRHRRRFKCWGKGHEKESDGRINLASRYLEAISDSSWFMTYGKNKREFFSMKLIEREIRSRNTKLRFFFIQVNIMLLMSLKREIIFLLFIIVLLLIL